MTGFVAAFEAGVGFRFPEPARTWTLEKNDPAALEAAWRSTFAEGAVAADLSHWSFPCLLWAGTADEMHDDARRAAAEIPGATFVPLEGHSHISAFYDADDMLFPHVRRFLRDASR
jgi:pimeloyl-ACP methyl ester carboxylesterase